MINKYERWSANLDDRIKDVNRLLDLWFKVGLRFIPLLLVRDYEKIYLEFIQYIKQKIDLQRVYSIFVWWLLYTKKDYNKILSKFPDLDILYMLELWDDDFYRENLEMRTKLYKMFKKLDRNCELCFETL